jgi:hypothetical protein
MKIYAAESAGVSAFRLSRWVKAAPTEGADAFSGTGNRSALK